jgi:hypothetical protein
VDHPDPVLAGDVDHLLKNSRSTHWVVGLPGKFSTSILGFGQESWIALQLLEEVHIRRQTHMAHVRPGDDESVGMDRIGRIGHQHRVARPHGGERQMRQPLLRADGDDRLAVRVQLNVETGLGTSADRLAQTRNAARHRVAMGVLTLRHLDQLVHDVLRGRLVGVAHAEVDDVLAPRSRLGLQLIDDVEDIGRQSLDAMEIGLGGNHGTTS